MVFDGVAGREAEGDSLAVLALSVRVADGSLVGVGRSLDVGVGVGRSEWVCERVSSFDGVATSESVWLGVGSNELDSDREASFDEVPVRVGS